MRGQGCNRPAPGVSSGRWRGACSWCFEGRPEEKAQKPVTENAKPGPGVGNLPPGARPL